MTTAELLETVRRVEVRTNRASVAAGILACRYGSEAVSRVVPDSKPIEFDGFGNCGEFAIIRGRTGAVIPVLIPSNSTGLEFNRSCLSFNPLEFEGIGSQPNDDHR